MFEGIPPTLIVNAAGVVIGAVAMLGVLRGWLVPGRSLDKILAVHTERLKQEKERGDEWKEAARLATERADQRDRQTEELLKVTNSAVTAFEALRRAADSRAEAGT